MYGPLDKILDPGLIDDHIVDRYSLLFVYTQCGT